MDYLDTLDMLDKKVSVIYADPPYTRDHYSRFYHVLETICLRDNPSISHISINGKESLTRGIYRNDRHQSPFSIKSRAPQAFENMFQKAQNLEANLILSYSPYDTNNGSHPRILTIDKLKKLGSKYYKKITIESLGDFNHSKLNKAELHLAHRNDAEVLIIYEN